MSAADRARVRSELAGFISAAAEEARILRECPKPEEGFLTLHLRKYILSKYMLPEDSTESDSIAELTALSLARMMQVAPDLVSELDTARSCAGATSATVKKALLFQAMERELHIELPAHMAVRAADVPALARLVQRCMTAG